MASNSKKGSYFKEHWLESRLHTEVYYPKELVTFFPWGECKHDETKSSQIYTINSISHITHKSNAAKIEAGATRFFFKPAMKYGKCGYEVTDGSPLGESYRCNLKHNVPTAETEYIHVAHDQPVLPDGYYSWWGASTVNHSMYGTEKLTTGFRHALGKFKWCQKDPDAAKPPDVYLRVGGTLRYRREICYVIIVHTDTEASAEIEALPPLRNNAHFKLNGFLDARGRVINWEVTPAFVPRFYSNGSFDQFAFAFYFDDCEKPLCLENVKNLQSLIQNVFVQFFLKELQNGAVLNVYLDNSCRLQYNRQLVQ